MARFAKLAYPAFYSCYLKPQQFVTFFESNLNAINHVSQPLNTKIFHHCYISPFIPETFPLSVVDGPRPLASVNEYQHDQLSNLVPSEDRLGLAVSAAGNLHVRPRLHRQVPWSICENRRY